MHPVIYQMDVGRFTDTNRTTFDLDALNETDSVITRSAFGGTHRTRWLYKDEDQKLVVLEKTLPVSTYFPRGTKLHISKVAGVAQPNHNNAIQPIVGRLAVNVDFAQPVGFQQRVVIDPDGTEHIALLVPIIIK